MKPEIFCSHHLSWAACKQLLVSEASSLTAFMQHLHVAAKPGLGDFEGFGIVMSGGTRHVLQAISNLRVLRSVHHSDVPVEFWHAFELGEAHCSALNDFGCRCRTLRFPGVYHVYQTILPAIMLSSFRHVLWMDTDITPLIAPERLFFSKAYGMHAALFWPDLWGAGCDKNGETAWPNHVAWLLLGLHYNRSNPHCTQEHETGQLLVDKVLHWRALCLANYLASRDFFTQVLHGAKDVFRLAWLKLNSSMWVSPVKPGLVGTVLQDGSFLPSSLVHFWPVGDEFGLGEGGQHIPVCIHQKKKPGRTWSEIVTFTTRFGDCRHFSSNTGRVTRSVHSPRPEYAQMWSLAVKHPKLYSQLRAVETEWEMAWKYGERLLENHTIEHSA